HDRPALGGVELAAGEDVERYLPGGDADIADPALEPNAAGGNLENFADGLGAQLQGLRRAGETASATFPAGTMGTACASGDGGEGRVGSIGTSVAPGEPVPGVSGTGTVSCGEIRLRAWAKACTGAATMNSHAAANTAERPIPLKPRPGMTGFSCSITAISCRGNAVHTIAPLRRRGRLTKLELTVCYPSRWIMFACKLCSRRRKRGCSDDRRRWTQADSGKSRRAVYWACSRQRRGAW